jgi:hypothetical protein
MKLGTRQVRKGGKGKVNRGVLRRDRGVKRSGSIRNKTSR